MLQLPKRRTLPRFDEIDLWHVDLNVGDDILRAYSTLLASSELVRINRFKFPIHARRFAVTRGALRILLAQVVGCHPRAIGFITNQYGKPRLDISNAPSFSVSHSDESAVVAIGSQELGIDIERERPIPEALRLAREFFANSEADALERALPECRSNTFLKWWTCKEACLKATGVGLSANLASFVVNGSVPYGTVIAPAEDRMRLIVHVQCFDLKSGYFGALATVQRFAKHVHLLEFVHGMPNASALEGVSTTAREPGWD
jgi:4'-phosphopantetheinyl transferase